MKRLLILALLLAGCSKPKPPATSTGAYSPITMSECGIFGQNTTWLPPCAGGGICYAEDDPDVTSNAPLGSNVQGNASTTKVLTDCHNGDAYWYVKFANGREMYGCGSVGTTIELEATK